MVENVYPFIDPTIQSMPVYIHLTDINSIESFFVFMDAAIRSHPFVLVASFALTLFIFYIITNSKNIYNYIISNYHVIIYGAVIALAVGIVYKLRDAIGDMLHFGKGR
jgi:hypothetical protein